MDTRVATLKGNKRNAVVDPAQQEVIDACTNTAEIVRQYVQCLLTASNPRVNRDEHPGGVTDPPPCSTRNLDIIDDDAAMERDYEELCNCCQRHVCRPGGCSKRTKARVNGKPCRIDIPMDHTDQAEIVVIETDKSAIRYMVKYASKGEKELQDVYNTVIRNANEEDSEDALTDDEISGDRGIGKGETSRLLIVGSHYKSPFKFTKLNLDLDSRRVILKDADPNAQTFCPSVLQKYGKREDFPDTFQDVLSAEMENLSLVEFSKRF
ncbi:hypothetical protein ROZALSC1DRAFT_23478 [Rozella allomycis CSF55]|uniref:Uncharacterized protein n=1 Tax=Rozella allomycis (strain CSF55) TaxID=988480 RepID=A0A4P9YFI1_ROZAC|nr:hypothetical protein ROZALSC1DRAFT_23478 [Rozella allomycis CSF55]